MAKPTPKSTLESIVECRSSKYNSIAFNTMELENRTVLMITAEDCGGSTTFFFEDAHELKTFANRVAAKAEAFLDE